MSDSPPDPFPFEPVPSATNRQDGWTPDRQRAFIAAFALIGMVSAAARAVGMSRKSAYALLERAGPRSSFARAWQAARSEGRARAEGTAIERAINGVEIPYFYRGEQRGVRLLRGREVGVDADVDLERSGGEPDAPTLPELLRLRERGLAHRRPLPRRIVSRTSVPPCGPAPIDSGR